VTWVESDSSKIGKKQKCVFLGNSLMSDKRCMMGDM
jgi:hypothetical protein